MALLALTLVEGLQAGILSSNSGEILFRGGAFNTGCGTIPAVTSLYATAVSSSVSEMEARSATSSLAT